MISIFLIIIIITVCLLLSLFIYVLIHSRENLKPLSINEKQKLKYSIRPSIDIITKKLPKEFSYRTNIKSQRLSFIDVHEKKEEESKSSHLISVRSHSLANNLFVSKSPNRGRGSIVDSNRIAQIEFSLPPTTEQYRRRSVAICNNIIDSKQITIDSIIKTIQSSNQFLPCLLSFSIIYLKSSQIKIQFYSLTSLPITIQFQQLTIQVKLIPDGKIKCLSIKNLLPNENIFSKDNNEYFIQFSNIPFGKLHEKAILMKIFGKDQSKKTIDLGQIGKIYFNQIKNLNQENQIDFLHEIEKIKKVRKKMNHEVKYFLLLLYSHQ